MTDNLLPTRRSAPFDPTERGRVLALRSTLAALVHTRRTLLHQLRAQLGQLRAQAGLLTGQRLGQHGNGGSPAASWERRVEEQYGLTPREMQVAALLAAGRGNASIAAALKISPHTARHHTQHVLAKLGVHSRAEAGALLRR